MTEPCHVIVTLTPRLGCVEEVLTVVSRELEEIRGTEGCEVYDLFRAVDDTVVLVEKWSDRDSWQRHFGVPAILRLKTDLTPLLEVPAERRELYAAGS
jgi:quinol monooxygenase YgiN